MNRIRAFVSIAAVWSPHPLGSRQRAPTKFPRSRSNSSCRSARRHRRHPARMFAQKLGEAGSPRDLVVENRPAGNGVLAYDAVAKAPPDGYLMLMGNHAAWR